MSSDAKSRDLAKTISIILNVVLFVVFVVLLVCYLVISKDEIIHEIPPVSHEQVIPITGKYYPDYIGGAAALQFQYDILDSKYFAMNDFYNMKSSGSLKILSNFRTYQQTSEYTCGCCCLLMAMDYVAHDTSLSEHDCAYLSDTGTDAHITTHEGAYPENLTHVLELQGYEYEANTCYNDTAFEDYNSFKEWVQESIDAGHPIIVLSNDWAGHYTIIIGIDTMGTDGPEDTYDDVLIMADPYDTTDHRQDGYNVWGLERFFDLWSVPIYLFEEKYQECSPYRYIKVLGKKDQESA